MNLVATYPRAVALLYQRIGATGLAAVAVCVGILTFIMADDPPRRNEWLDFLSLFAVTLYHGVFFASCIGVGRRLSADPAKIRRPARWVGFLMAILYFPLLTIPGLVAVYKRDKFFKEALIGKDDNAGASKFFRHPRIAEPAHG